MFFGFLVSLQATKIGNLAPQQKPGGSWESECRPRQKDPAPFHTRERPAAPLHLRHLHHAQQGLGSLEKGWWNFLARSCCSLYQGLLHNLFKSKVCLRCFHKTIYHNAWKPMCCKVGCSICFIQPVDQVLSKSLERKRVQPVTKHTLGLSGTPSFSTQIGPAGEFQLLVGIVPGVPSPFFPGILLFRKLQKPKGNSRILKRTMIEKDGESTPGLKNIREV